MAESTRPKDPSATPSMRQYLAVKEQYQDAILFFRIGDFYEMFFEDAVVASAALDLTLTSRNKNDPDPIPMAGVPHHAALAYVSRLIEQGHKVAICDQLEDPTKVKGLVKREVVRVITPGVVLDEENLDAKANNFLAAVLPLDDAAGPLVSAAVAVIDASTFDFRGTRVTGLGALAGELCRLEPREILAPKAAAEELKDLSALIPRCYITPGDDALFDPKLAVEALAELVGPEEAARIRDEDPLLARAAGAAAGYVRATRPRDALPSVRFASYRVSDHMVIDEAAKAHLELVRAADGEKKGSLLWLLDRTRTAMGGRLLRRWINYPLTDVAAIRRRLDRVELFFRDAAFRGDTTEALAAVGDLERIAARIGMRVAAPRDLGVLRSSLAAIADLDDLVTSCPAQDADEVLGGPLDRARDLVEALGRALVDDPPIAVREGGVFREGFDPSLDELVRTARDAKELIAALEAKERARTGIASLKIQYNRVFGYYILVTKAHLKSVPTDYVRKQTVVGGERFVTAELEEWESKVLYADERRKELEQELYARLVDDLGAHTPRLFALARRVAELDCAASLAEVARARDFVRPEVDAGDVVDIADGRHPLVEVLRPETPFVPNDVRIDPDGERLLLITGPNMAGKSTVMRQVALCVVLAQMGSFVPAARARIGVCDRLFTRVGASDNIARGASTFMVEMRETAAILRGATASSLVILDEVGRGTSTYDGLSIAWAVGEYLHDAVRCKVMFATHYHELVELVELKEHAANYHVAAREYGEDVVFLRKLVRGGTSHSFGIQVARMAGLPETVVQRAREVLRGLETDRPAPIGMPESARRGGGAHQLDLFAAAKPSEAERAIGEIDLDRVTPLEALALLASIKKLIGAG
jgi:DNA mismatch repair protein MutS